MKIDAADTAFSHYIRLRDMCCLRCGSQVRLNEKGLPITHHNSHFFGRGNESTRYDPDNCDTLCYGCHVKWEKEDHESYRDFKKKQLGEKRFNALVLRAHSYCKRDRKLALIKARELLKKLLESKLRGTN